MREDHESASGIDRISLFVFLVGFSATRFCSIEYIQEIPDEESTQPFIVQYLVGPSNEGE